MTTQVNSTVLGTLGNINVTGNVLASSHVGGSVNVTGNVLANNLVGGSVNVTGNILSAGAVHNSLTVNGNTNITGTTTLATALSGIAKLTSGVVSTGTAGSDYVAPATATTFTATQTFNGSSSSFAARLLNAVESMNIVAAAPSATTNVYISSGTVQYYTSNATTNWILNIAFSANTSCNTAMSVGDSLTVTFMATQSANAYYNTSVTIDSSAVSPKWVGGAPTKGNASGIDVYTYAIIKTATTPTYTVLASQTQFK